jgi:hypothetical protein
MFALLVSPVWAQQAQSIEPVPTWLTWKVFYESLDFYGKKSPQQDTKIVTEQFRLLPNQATALLNSGQSYVADIQRIDGDARAEAAKRYKYVPLQTGRPDPNSPKSRPAIPQKSIQERATEDGFAAEVEAKKSISLANHMNALARDVGAAKLDEIKTFVEKSIAPHIKSIAAPDLRSTGTTSLPLSLTPEAPTTAARTR